MVLTATKVTVAREDFVEGGGSLLFDDASGIAVIRRSGYREDDVDGLVLQQSSPCTETPMASPRVNVGLVRANTSTKDSRECRY